MKAKLCVCLAVIIVVSFADSLAALSPLDGPPPDNMGAFQQFLCYDIAPLIFLAMMPVSIPRVYFINAIERIFHISLISNMSQYSNAMIVLFNFCGDVFICLLYATPFAVLYFLWQKFGSK